MKRISCLLIWLSLGTLLLAQTQRLWVDVDRSSTKARTRLATALELRTPDGYRTPAYLDTVYGTSLLYFPLPQRDSSQPYPVTVSLYGNEADLALPPTQELLLIHTDEGDYFPHDLTLWRASELQPLYHLEMEARQARGDMPLSYTPQDPQDPADLEHYADGGLKYHYQAAAEQADQLEEIGNHFFTVLGILLGLALLGMMVVRIRLQQEQPRPRWIEAEQRFSQAIYLLLSLFVMHTAFFFDFDIISLNGPPSYVVEFNTLAEGLLGMLIIAIFALNASYLVPQFLVPRDYRGYLLRLSAVFGLAMLPYVALNDWLLESHLAWVDGRLVLHSFEKGEGQDPMAPYAAIWLGSTLLVSTFLAINRLFIRQQVDQLRQQSSQLSANLRQLQAQISPHFFFNTLNSVYGFALEEDSPRTVEALEKLSSLMRFAIYEGKEAFLPLEKEIAYLSDYVDLQRLRLDPERHEVRFDVHGEAPGARVAPLLLITLIENAFKHGLSMRHRSFIHIHLDLAPHALTLHVANSLHPQPVSPTGGLGLANVQQRLDLLYPGRYHWQQGRYEDRYETTLAIRVH